MISVSGVRGVVGDGLRPEVALHFAQAYGSEFGPGRIVVGRDSRVTGEMIKYAVWSGLTSVGCDVVDIGMAPTPTTALVTERKENSGGIIITASHNPKEWNALKLLAPDGLFLNSDQGARIRERVEKQEYDYSSWDQVGRIKPFETAIEDHIKAVANLELVHVAQIRRRQFKIVVDCCNGAGGTILPQLFEYLGCNVIFLNLEPSGYFPRSPEPIPENLTELCDAVTKHGAHLGIAVDPDVDRLALVDENGKTMGEEYTLSLATAFVLSKKSGAVVVNASTSQVIDDIARQHNAAVHRTAVGEIHVAAKARDINAVMAGEGNGGVIYPDLHYGRDAMAGIALILQYLAEAQSRISSLHQRLPQYTMIKDKITLPFTVNARAIVKKLIEMHKNDHIDLTDGLKILHDKAWVHIRASNTEPIIRIIAEATSREQTHQLIENLRIEANQLV